MHIRNIDVCATINYNNKIKTKKRRLISNHPYRTELDIFNDSPCLFHVEVIAFVGPSMCALCMVFVLENHK